MTKPAAEKEARKNRAQSYDVLVKGEEVMYGRQFMKKKNPTKAQKREKTRKVSAKRRVAVALGKYLKQLNPGSKLAGAKVEKLAGGVLKITPIKANAARKSAMYGLVYRGEKLAAYSNRTAARGARTSVF